MKTSIIDTDEAPNKWWAFKDASMRNAVNATRYSQKERTRAERMKLALELVYFAKSIYIAFGITGVSIKVDKARIKNNKDLALLEQDWGKQGVYKKVSPQGITYRFKVS